VSRCPAPVEGELSTGSERSGKRSQRGARDGKIDQLAIAEERILAADVPASSRFKGYQDVLVQDLVLRPHVVRFRRERWLAPNGRTVTAPMPTGIIGHFGPELRRFVLFQGVVNLVGGDDRGSGAGHAAKQPQQVGRHPCARGVAVIGGHEAGRHWGMAR
jgi:hypothetical protein